jgi:hypothetical protein
MPEVRTGQATYRFVSGIVIGASPACRAITRRNARFNMQAEQIEIKPEPVPGWSDNGGDRQR